MRKALTKEQVRSIVGRHGGSPGIPVMMAKWWGAGLRDVYGSRLDEIDAAYPDDVCMLWYQQPGFCDLFKCQSRIPFWLSQRLRNFEKHSIGQHTVLLPDWDELDQFLSHMPDPNEPGNFQEVTHIAQLHPDQYKIGSFWFFLA